MRINPNRIVAWAAAAVSTAAPSLALAQPLIDEPRHEIAWNRYYTADETDDHMRALAEAYPDLVELRNLGRSREGRPLLMVIITAPGEATHAEKPAMWIDGNIHGNEIQASEVVLYSAWFLASSYGENEQITSLLDRTAFYLMPMVNPDGRASWFADAHTPHSSRRSRTPFDNDRDGLIDEDGPEDLDGDGSITQMWLPDPDGDWIRDRADPRIFRRLGATEFDDDGERFTRLGSEGIDNDNDGRRNEDPIGGNDLNRNWPGDWKPEYVQGGAGQFPFSNPETAAVGAFVLDHPNIAAFQSYHNTGGMMLRGPGVAYLSDRYPAADRRVYDEMGRLGEQMMPYYRYLVIHRDLYGVHGGEVTWAAESLGIVSFTNELWTVGKYFQRDGARPNEERMMMFRDRLEFGTTFADYTEYEHPRFGTVLIGGPNKWSSRSTPPFMLEEECHRNFAFTAMHAGEMPELRFGRTDVVRRGTNTWQVTAEVRNDRLIPTRTAVAAQRGIGRRDILQVRGGRVVTGGTVRSWTDRTFTPALAEPERLLLDSGVPGRGARIARWIIEAPEGSVVELTYDAQKAVNIETRIRLAE